MQLESNYILESVINRIKKNFEIKYETLAPTWLHENLENYKEEDIEWL
jgi:hypothetical protein